MTLPEILSELHSLPRSEKLRVIQSLVSDLAKDEGAAALEPNQRYPVWAPYDAFEAADTMLNALKTESSADAG